MESQQDPQLQPIEAREPDVTADGAPDLPVHALSLEESAPQPHMPVQEPLQQQEVAPQGIPPQAMTPDSSQTTLVPSLAPTDEGQKHMDQTMDQDDSMNTTITASTVSPPLPEFHQQNNHSGFGQEPTSYHRPQSSYSDQTYSPRYSHQNTDSQYQTRFTTSSDAETPPRHGYYNGGKETQMGGRSQSRPSSALGYRTGSENGNGGARYSDQSQRSSQGQAQQEAAKSTSVVIKVGMVGDAQIGKTSLMVKYVEGSWDEDYIQTLGESVSTHVLEG